MECSNGFGITQEKPPTEAPVYTIRYVAVVNIIILGPTTGNEKTRGFPSMVLSVLQKA